MQVITPTFQTKYLATEVKYQVNGKLICRTHASGKTISQSAHGRKIGITKSHLLNEHRKIL